jgi:hypothetical protein
LNTLDDFMGGTAIARQEGYARTGHSAESRQ